MDHRDVVEIHQLIALYGHAADAPDQSLLPLVFTEDAVVDTRPCGHDVVEGLAAIAAWFAQGKPPHPPSHHTTNPYVYEQDSEVRVRSKWFVVNRHDGTAVTGDYDDVVVRTGEGWRIRRRIVTPRFPAVVDFTRKLAES